MTLYTTEKNVKSQINDMLMMFSPITQNAVNRILHCTRINTIISSMIHHDFKITL